MLETPLAEMVEFDPSESPMDVDFVEEIRLRTWARQNYAPASERDQAWHPIVHDEMLRRDREALGSRA